MNSKSASHYDLPIFFFNGQAVGKFELVPVILTITIVSNSKMAGTDDESDSIPLREKSVTRIEKTG